jgi:hypothetical protein
VRCRLQNLIGLYNHNMTLQNNLRQESEHGSQLSLAHARQMKQWPTSVLQPIIYNFILYPILSALYQTYKSPATITNSTTNTNSRIFLQNLTVAQLVTEFSIFYGIGKTFTVFTRAQLQAPNLSALPRSSG